jgi:SnoaL-like domain
MQTYDEAFVDRFMTPWNAHDVDGAMALMTDVASGRSGEALSHTVPISTDRRTFVRPSPMPSGRCRTLPMNLVHASFGPDVVVLELLVTGRLPGGEKAKFRACDAMTVRDGKVAAKRSYRKVVE